MKHKKADKFCPSLHCLDMVKWNVCERNNIYAFTQHMVILLIERILPRKTNANDKMIR